MRFARLVSGCAIVATLSLSCSHDGFSQEKKDGKAMDELPFGWSKLNLTKEQTAEVLKLKKEHDEAVAKLKLEIAKFDAEWVKKRLDVLTEEQRKKLRERSADDKPPEEKSGRVDGIQIEAAARGGPRLTVRVEPKPGGGNWRYDVHLTTADGLDQRLEVRNGRPIARRDVRLTDLTSDGFLDLLIVGGKDHRGEDWFKAWLSDPTARRSGGSAIRRRTARTRNSPGIACHERPHAGLSIARHLQDATSSHRDRPIVRVPRLRCDRRRLLGRQDPVARSAGEVAGSNPVSPIRKCKASSQGIAEAVFRLLPMLRGRFAGPAIGFKQKVDCSAAAARPICS